MNSTTRPPVPTPSGTTPFPWPPLEFRANQARMPRAELCMWAGKHVAWSWDGTRIVAGADTLADLMNDLRRVGTDTSTVVFDYIDVPGE